MMISVEGTGKNQLDPGLESMGDAPVLSHCFWQRNPLYQNRPVCWSIVVKEKPIVGSSLSGAFPSDRILNGVKDNSVPFFIQSINSCKLY
jgi:hypothetical protein